MANFFDSVLNTAENVGARIPVVGDLLGLQTNEEKRLLARQKQMAAEAKLRQGHLAQAAMQGTAQSLLAFNPMNQMMAQQFGPSAAFTPGQFAQMVQNPMGSPQMDPSLVNYQGNDPKKQAQVQEALRRMREYEEAERRRREMMMNGITEPGAGPAPLKPTQVAPGRRY